MKHGDHELSAGFGKRFRIEEQLRCHCGGNGLGWILNPGGGSTTPQTPDPRVVGGQFGALAQDFANYEPLLLGTQQQFQPSYIQLAGQGLNQAAPDWLNLFGTATGTAAGAQNQANRTLGGGQVQDVTRLGGQAATAVRWINPNETHLLDQLTSTASSQLAAGTTLAPQDVNAVTQSVRGDWANRGLGTSPTAQLSEAMQLFGGGQNVLAERERAGQSIAQQEQSSVTLPALSLVSGQSNAPQMGAGLESQISSQVQGAGPTLFPLNQAYDLFGTAYNAQAAANIAGANNQAALDAY